MHQQALGWKAHHVVIFLFFLGCVLVCLEVFPPRNVGGFYALEGGGGLHHLPDAAIGLTPQKGTRCINFTDKGTVTNVSW